MTTQRSDGLTPVQVVGTDLWLKRDDLYSFGGVHGGKVRSCLALAERAKAEGKEGLVTAGSRSSPQVEIVAHVARRLKLRCRCHVPAGADTDQLKNAVRAGAELVRHRPGHNSVIVARARDDARQLDWANVPFGMECQEAVDETARQVANLPWRMERLVVPVGSGMSLAGILWGLVPLGAVPPVLGVVVGASPERRLDRWGPPEWRFLVQLVPAGVPYSERVTAILGGVRLDPIYEAKCVPHLQRGDVLWVVGCRGVNE